ncbi:MAG: hypothetical protein LBG08_03000 [Spirochaetaceae bacterium]|jgi:hypothetical protein|nr:hypothetical protein [Spirochaetaceae bacterium]
MKNRVIILAFFVVVWLGACADDLLVDTLNMDNKVANQIELDENTPVREEPLVEEPVIEENIPSQEEPLAGEAVIEENIPSQEEPLAGEAVIEEDIPVLDPLAENAVAVEERFNWAVFIAERAAWEQMAWGQTGYSFKQTHKLSNPAFSMTKNHIIYQDVPYGRSDKRSDISWAPLLMADTMSDVYDIIYGLGITDKAALADRGLTSFWIKYNRKFHYPEYIEITGDKGLKYTVNISIYKMNITGVSTNGGLEIQVPVYL